MRLVGLLLLIAVLVVGYGTFRSLTDPSGSSLAVIPAQPQPAQQPVQQVQPSVSVAQPAPTPAPAPAAQVEPDRPMHGCVAAPGNAHGASPSLSVADGHLLSVQWYYDGGPQEQSILPAGTWQPVPGVRVGAYWDYPACDMETVVNQAVASNGNVTDLSNGFSGS